MEKVMEMIERVSQMRQKGREEQGFVGVRRETCILSLSFTIYYIRVS